MTVEDIVRDYLRIHGYDGLHDGDDCGCLAGNLAPCGQIGTFCEAGIRLPCPPTCGDHEWHIGPRPPSVRWTCAAKCGNHIDSDEIPGACPCGETRWTPGRNPPAAPEGGE